ncbi:MAG: DUF4299 family protein [Solobacterium sp.]|nr:DUF4299 family protein [Solobacterium sp.]
MPNPAVDVELRQIRPLARFLPDELFLLPGMGHGRLYHEQLIPNETSSHGFVAYLPEHLGRGIRVRRKQDNPRSVFLNLALPASREEIAAVFAMTRQVCAQRMCRIFLGGTEVRAASLDRLQKDYEVFNLKVLHHLMRNVINEETGNLIMSCAMHSLTAGVQEAEQFWAGTDPDVFRDWMHRLQSVEARVAEPEILRNNETGVHTGVYDLRAGETTLFPQKPMIPLRFYDLKTGVPATYIENWQVRLVDPQQRQTYGYLPFARLRAVLPAEKVFYYDGGRYGIMPLEENEFYDMVLKGEDTQCSDQ